MEPGLLCVHAHPDDEAILTGGVLARYADEGFRTAVVTCTGGEEGQIVGAGMDPDEIRPRLAEVRRAELEAGLEILGAGPPRFLGYRDSGMMGEDSNRHPDAFWGASVDEAVGRLVGVIREFRPSVVVTYDAFGGYGHPDHIQTHRVGLLAAEAAAVGALYPEAGPGWRVSKTYLASIPKSYFALAGRYMTEIGLDNPFGEVEDPADLPVGVPDAEITATVDVRPWIDRKWRALLAHHSQLAADSLFLSVSEELRVDAFGTEWFIGMRGAGPSEDDLFAGLR
jgi:N-acetyl-1-D-myo-inositol-2-amino-2-deoxy-alpha-D-glucopyranoside deacetylase